MRIICAWAASLRRVEVGCKVLDTVCQSSACSVCLNAGHPTFLSYCD